MSRRKADGLAGLARDTARGRQIVMSAGSIDGAMLEALRKVQDRLQPAAQPTIQPDAGSVVSSWGPGVTLGDQVKGGDDGKDKTL